MPSPRLLRNVALIGLPLGLLAAFLLAPSFVAIGPSTRAPTPAPGPAPVDQRAAVVAAAVSQLGNTDPTAYWHDALATHPLVAPAADWCGVFALWCLHQARLALDWNWQIGSGFLLSTVHPSLPKTSNPLPGDIAYFDHLEHEAIVETVTPSAVELINGNGTGGAVTRSVALRSSVTAFFSIAPLLSSEAA